MNSSIMKTLVSGVVAAQLAVIASADEMDPSVGWEKTLWHGTREFRVLAYTNTTETYQFELPENVTWIDCICTAICCPCPSGICSFYRRVLL